MSRNSALEFLAFLNCWWGSSKDKFDSQISFSSKLHSLYFIADWVLILKELKILTDIWVTLRGFEPEIQTEAMGILVRRWQEGNPWKT